MFPSQGAPQGPQQAIMQALMAAAQQQQQGGGPPQGAPSPSPTQAPPQDDSAGPQVNSLPTPPPAAPSDSPTFIGDPTLIARGKETEADALEKLRRQYFGLKDGESEPNSGQKRKMGALEVLRGLFQADYKSPRDRMQAIVDKQFPADTARLNTGTALERVQAQAAQADAARKTAEAKLDENIRNHKAVLDQKVIDERNRTRARDVLNGIRDKNTDSLVDWRNNAGALSKVKADFYQQKIDEPDLTAGRYASRLIAEQEAKLGRALTLDESNNLVALAHAASSPLKVLGSTSTTFVQDGVQQTHSNKLFGNMFGLGQGQSRSPLAPSASPAVPAVGAPAAPPANPAAALGGMLPTPTPPAEPKAPWTRNDISNPRIDIPSNVRVTPKEQAMHDVAVKGMNDTLHKMGSFEMQANAGVDNMLNSILSGKAKDFQGALAGNSFIGDMRTMFGNVSPQEALQKLFDTDMLYTKLGINIRGRFTVPEIAGHLRNMGSLTQKPENALMAIGALKLQANIQRLYESGKIDTKDVPVLNSLVRNELNRLQKALNNATPEDRASAAQGKPLGEPYRINSIEDLMRGVGQDKGTGPKTPVKPSITLDDINAEMAKRKKK